jgi:hypothetical protein
LDNWLLKITTRRWQQKSNEGRLNKNGNTMSLVTGNIFPGQTRGFPGKSAG